MCFDCIRLICHNLNLGPFVEEMFEVFACYFPIDFNPVTLNLTVTEINSFAKINFFLSQEMKTL